MMTLNARTGQDWQQWIAATWRPCSTLLGAPPPITWGVPATWPTSDPRKTGETANKLLGFVKYKTDTLHTAADDKVIPKYGVCSSIPSLAFVHYHTYKFHQVRFLLWFAPVGRSQI